MHPRRYQSKGYNGTAYFHSGSARHVDGVLCDAYMLISTMPRDQTSAARGLYVGAALFLHSERKEGISCKKHTARRGGAPKLMYGALPQSMSEDSRSVVERPKSVSLTTTRRSSRPSGCLVQPSVTMKFSGLMSRWNTFWEWQAATASHIWENMDAMRRRRVLDRSWEGWRLESKLGVGGVREVEIESESRVDESKS